MPNSDAFERDLICIICPRGCSLHVVRDASGSLSVSGNTCPRGARYALDECTHPMRTLTSTVRTSSGGVIPVKTDRPIPKELLFDAMLALSSCVASLPASIGDVVLSNLLGTGANVVITANS